MFFIYAGLAPLKQKRGLATFPKPRRTGVSPVYFKFFNLKSSLSPFSSPVFLFFSFFHYILNTQYSILIFLITYHLLLITVFATRTLQLATFFIFSSLDTQYYILFFASCIFNWLIGQSVNWSINLFKTSPKN